MIEKILPETVYYPESWPELTPRNDIGDNLYAVQITEAFRAMVSVSKKQNTFLYHGPSEIAYCLTNNTYHWENKDGGLLTFVPEVIPEIERFLREGKLDGYKGIELNSYDSMHPIVERLIELKHSNDLIMHSIIDLNTQLLGFNKNLSQSKVSFRREFLPKENF